jgi:hypothetical protein
MSARHTAIAGSGTSGPSRPPSRRLWLTQEPWNEHSPWEFCRDAGVRNHLNTEPTKMRKLVSMTVLAGVLSAFALPALAQTTTPKGPQDCKATEKWDAATRTCKPQ